MLHMMEGTSVKSYLDKFSSIIMDLRSIDVKIKEEDDVLLLLCSLPPSYKNFHETFLFGRDTLCLDDVKSSLLSKERIDMQTSNETGGALGEALVSRGRSQEKGSNNRGTTKSKSKHRNLICGYRKKKGHIKADCFKLKNKEQWKKNDDKHQG